jgi:hypothetical protein
MSERFWKYLSIVLTVAVIVAASLVPASGAPVYRTDEGSSSQNCRTLNHLGSPMVCDKASIQNAVPLPDPSPASPPRSAAPSSPVVSTGTEAAATQICFPARSWSTAYGASAEDRPCDVLFRPQEDGSTRLVLGTVGADAAVCVVPNPYEERGHFDVECHRVPNR